MKFFLLPRVNYSRWRETEAAAEVEAAHFAAIKLGRRQNNKEKLNKTIELKVSLFRQSTSTAEVDY